MQLEQLLSDYKQQHGIMDDAPDPGEHLAYFILALLLFFLALIN